MKTRKFTALLLVLCLLLTAGGLHNAQDAALAVLGALECAHGNGGVVHADAGELAAQRALMVGFHHMGQGLVQFGCAVDSI